MVYSSDKTGWLLWSQISFIFQLSLRMPFIKTIFHLWHPNGVKPWGAEKKSGTKVKKKKKQSNIICFWTFTGFEASQMAWLWNGGVVIKTRIFRISRDTGNVLLATRETSVLIQTDRNQTNFSKCRLRWIPSIFLDRKKMSLNTKGAER